jgi:ubiquinone/menaquinone biosynthesis C-methylase UbiE
MTEDLADPRLFKGTADYYLKFRSRYPDLLIKRVAQLCNLRSTARVLDLGCGPGTLVRAFAPFCGVIIGVDPEPRMIAAAKQYVIGSGCKTEFICASAHELSVNIGTFSLVTIGRAFHWMDRKATLEMLDTIVDPQGAVALFRDPATKLPENAWRTAFDRVFSRFATTEVARLGAQKVSIAVDEAYLLRSAFSHLERISTFQIRSLTVEQLIGRAFSMAGTSPDDLMDKRSDFENALREALAPFLSHGQLTEITEPQALIARRESPVISTRHGVAC